MIEMSSGEPAGRATEFFLGGLALLLVLGIASLLVGVNLLFWNWLLENI